MEELITACQWAPSQYLIISDNVFAPLIYYSHFFAITVSLFLGILIYLKGRKILLNNILFSITVFLSLWIFGDLVLWASEKPSIVMFFWSLINLFEPFIYAGSVYFLYVFIDKKDISLNKKIVFGAMLLPVIVFASTKFSLLGFNLADCDRAAIEGPLAQYGYIIEILFVIWIIILGIRRYHSAVIRETRAQILIITTALVIFLLSFSLGNIVEVFTDNWGIGQIGLVGVPIFVGILAYLIIKFKAFDIKLIATQALVWALGFLVSAALFVRTIGNIRIVLLATLLLVIMIGYALVRSVKREIEQKERLEVLSANLEALNASLAQANEKLKGLDKLKTEFLSLASHQLRSPLTAIKGYASMLIEGSFTPLAEKQDVAVKRIYSSAQGLVSIVEELLNVSKIEQGGMKYEFMPTDLSTIVTNLYNEMKIPAEAKGLDFRLSLPNYDKFMVNADPVKIKQVFLNLTDNSIKYTQNGFVEISLSRDDTNVWFAVHDSGIGISPETKAKLFEKFSRGEGGRLNTGGSGLGLYLAKQIAIAHKGDVIIESEGLGKGSVFKVYIPAVGAHVTPDTMPS